MDESLSENTNLMSSTTAMKHSVVQMESVGPGNVETQKGGKGKISYSAVKDSLNNQVSAVAKLEIHIMHGVRLV